MIILLYIVLKKTTTMHCAIWSAYHLYGNFGEKQLKTSVKWYWYVFDTENRNRIELYHLQNTGKFFAFSGREAWH